MNKHNIEKDLNTLLQTYQIASHNVQKFHLLVKDNAFFEIHEHTENLYNEYNDKVDEIAELLLSIGLTPETSISEALKNSLIKEHQSISTKDNGMEIVDTIIQYTKQFINIQSELLLKVEQEKKRMLEIDHDAISYSKLSIVAATLTDYIKSQSKFLWMLSSTK